MNASSVRLPSETEPVSAGGEPANAEREQNAVADEVAMRIRSFLAAQGLPDDAGISQLHGGANNRVYRVSFGGRDHVLKVYFHKSADPRDRFGVEQAFYNFLWTAGVRRTAEPLAWDETARVGLFTSLEGQRVLSGEVARDHVEQALSLVSELNSARRHPLAAHVPAASEAHFSLAAHLDCVDRRMQRIEKAAAEVGAESEFAAFVRNELQPAWERTRVQISRTASAAGLDLRAELPAEQRCLSPSDFGFHNALLDADGRLFFYDFEYAGWDDPAKLACDFFCQPQVPVPHEYREEFVGRLEDIIGDESVRDRVRQLWPVYQFKWCCIMLNEFVRADAARRKFAAGGECAGGRRSIQLARAREALARLGRFDAGETVQ